MDDLSKRIYELMQDYRELGEMMPADHPGARLLPRLNSDLERLSIELLTAANSNQVS